MKIAVISDLHLGRGDSSDPFGHDESEFLRFLRFLESEFERIVLLGDIYETLWSRLPGDQRGELLRCRDAHRRIVSRFEDRERYQYVHGNHDWVAADVLGTPEEILLEADGMRLLFTHGHHYDWILRNAREIAELGVWAAAWLVRMGLTPAFRLLERADKHWRASADPGSCGFQRWAVQAAAARDADVVVTGHTHLRTAAEHGSRLYLNSGTCSGGTWSFLHIDTRTGVYGTGDSW